MVITLINRHETFRTLPGTGKAYEVIFITSSLFQLSYRPHVTRLPPPPLTCLTGTSWAGGRWASLSGPDLGLGALERRGRLRSSSGCCALGRGKGAPWGLLRA